VIIFFYAQLREAVEQLEKQIDGLQQQLDVHRHNSSSEMSQMQADCHRATVDTSR